MDDHRGLQTRYDSDRESTGLALWQLTNRWQSAQRAALRPHGLTHVQFVLLASLVWLEASSDGPISQKRLATHAGADVMMTSQVVRVLAGRDLLRRQPAVGDRRSLALSATAEGRRLVNRAVVAVEQVDESFFAVLGDERAGFTAWLRRLAADADPTEA